MLPDPELVVVDFLRGYDFVDGVTVCTELPARREPEPQSDWEARVFPALRINGFPGGTTRALATLAHARVQVDVWATSKWEVSRIARSAFAALHAARQWRHVDGDGLESWLLGVRTVNPPGWMPDPETKRPRQMFDVNVLLRTRTASSPVTAGTP